MNGARPVRRHRFTVEPSEARPRTKPEQFRALVLAFMPLETRPLVEEAFRLAARETESTNPIRQVLAWVEEFVSTYSKPSGRCGDEPAARASTPEAR